ncbi:aromatic compound dioxygenase [Sistotremastrum niveocremeum HHB9708]|uniref:Aromatic compound dioxygenase n=1 Tax=Sistotremastrum niveocremeum HHB9708 TaxID=1314777 RepID=A0A164T9K2_9AGAM|nr:aromatic compound dioxygenase [Sistotremastrum niveocremeum HHB9708]
MITENGEHTANSIFHPARPIHTPPLSLLLTAFRALYTNLSPWAENVLFWRFFRGRKNAQAEIEGPYYVLGAPFREVAPGKAMLATKEMMKENQPFLFTGRVTTTDGEPIPGALIDIWHANTNSQYYFASYTLRGKLHTDLSGRFEILTVAPGGYLGRAGHFHYIVTPPKEYGDLNEVTTQAYVCGGNNEKELDGDFANWFRKPRYQNTVQAWSLPPSTSPDESVKGHYSFPVVNTLDAETDEAVKRWNKWLEAEGAGEGVTIEAGGYMGTTLTKKGRWL